MATGAALFNVFGAFRTSVKTCGLVSIAPFVLLKSRETHIVGILPAAVGVQDLEKSKSISTSCCGRGNHLSMFFPVRSVEAGEVGGVGPRRRRVAGESGKPGADE